MNELSIGVLDDNILALKQIKEIFKNENDLNILTTDDPNKMDEWISNNRIDGLACDYLLNKKFNGADYLRTVFQKYENPPPASLFSTSGLVKPEEDQFCRIHNIDIWNKAESYEAIIKNVVDKVKSEGSDRSVLTSLKYSQVESDIWEKEIANNIKIELLHSLSKIKNKNTEILTPDGETYRIDKLINEISIESEIGIRFIKYWSVVKLKLNNLLGK